jgi:hypothetical protein
MVPEATDAIVKNSRIFHTIYILQTGSPSNTRIHVIDTVLELAETCVQLRDAMFATPILESMSAVVDEVETEVAMRIISLFSSFFASLNPSDVCHYLRRCHFHILRDPDQTDPVHESIDAFLYGHVSLDSCVT